MSSAGRCDEAGRWVHWLQAPQDVRLDLYCIPHAGGAADAFAGWRDHLPADVAMAAVQLPGRRERFHDPRPADIASVATTLANLIGRDLSRPVMLFGHSLGALIAFETALRLEGRRAPLEIMVAGCGAPTRTRRAKAMHDLPSPEFRARLRAMGGTPPEILADEGLMALFEPVLRADLKLAETYRAEAGARTSAFISAWGGVDDALVPLEDLAAWSECTRAGHDLRMFPGGHFFPHTHAGSLLPALRARLKGCMSIRGEPARQPALTNNL
jgi:medium-chain acyl-[acyl-carrier-protein] hydrolase